MRSFLRLLCGLLLLPVAGRAQTLLTDSLLIDGHYRTFHYTAPRHRKAAVLFVLHGSGGDGRGFARYQPTAAALAARENVIVVFPDGYRRYWNECRKAATTPPNVENINEQAFFEGMLTYLRRRCHARPRQAYALGMSGGGHMAYKLALTMPDRFPAIAAVVANLPAPENLDCGEARRPVAVLIVNGTADPVNPYDGGEVNVPNVRLGRVRSTAETVQYWATLDGYTAPAVAQALPDPNPTDAIRLEREAYEDPRRPDVVLIRVIGGDHSFPADYDTFGEAWRFFQRQAVKRK